MLIRMVSTAIFRGLRGNFSLTGLRLKNFYPNCISRRSIFTRKMSLTREVYIRIEDNADSFRLSFSYCEEGSGNEREVHFRRSLKEIVQLLCNRISLKLNVPVKKNRKKDNSSEGRIDVPVLLLKNGAAVCNTTTCKELFDSDSSDLTLKIGNQDFSFVKNAPWIDTITLPKIIMAGFFLYPQKVEGLYIDESESEYLWFKFHDDGDDELVGSDLLYIPTTADIGYKLKLQFTPGHNGLKGPMVEICSTCEVEAGPGYCPFEDRHVFTNKSLTGNSFRVVSYNILADLYASSTAGKHELFSYCAPYALSIDYRKQLLFKELIGYNADIICLQEVDCRVFKRDLKRILSTKNMDGILAKKGGQVNEGVACFFNQSRLRLLSDFHLTLGEDSLNEEFLKNIWNRVNTNDTLCVKMKERTTVVQVLVFTLLENPKHKIVVANTHLYFHPDADHIRLLQAGMCLHFVEDVVKKFQSESPESTFSIVFCGDFNSTPECAVYQLFTTGEVSSDHNELIRENETVTGLSLRTPFSFKSACGTPEFTNYTVGFKGCLDYIYYQTDFLDIEQVIPFPPEEEVCRYIAIPSVVFPSDHVALVADLKLKD